MTSHDFWIIFAAVISANLLTVMFVWASIGVSRREQRKEPLGVYIWSMLFVLAFTTGALYVAFGGQ